MRTCLRFGNDIRCNDDGNSQMIVVWNVHNERISSADRDNVLANIREDLTNAQRWPGRFVVIVLGDFNLRHRGESKLTLDGGLPFEKEFDRSDANSRKWQEALAGGVEVAQ
eukprot:12012711-Karenia_brevis.AAC.1